MPRALISILSNLTILVYFGLLASPLDTRAQYLPELDTIPSFELMLAELLFEPFEDDPKAIMDNFNVLLAYEAWVQTQRFRDFMPLAERIDLLTERARSEMLIGVHLAIILEEYVVMESGVFPITETAIARLDSASSRYREIIQYGVEGTELLYQMDADFAAFVSDSLKVLRERFRYEPIVTATGTYDARRIIVNCFYAARRDNPSHVYRRSLAWWFYETLNEL